MTKAYELLIKLTEDGKLDLPADLVEELLDGDDLKVIILVPDRRDVWQEPEGGRLAYDRFGVGYSASESGKWYLRYHPRPASPDRTPLEEHKAAILQALEARGGGWTDSFHLAYEAMEYLNEPPPDDPENMDDPEPDYDYAGIRRALNYARDVLLKEGKIVCSPRGQWSLVRKASG